MYILICVLTSVVSGLMIGKVFFSYQNNECDLCGSELITPKSYCKNCIGI